MRRSGSFIDSNEAAKAADVAAIAAGVAAAMAATTGAQASSGRFLVEWGADVLGGHTDMAGPAGGSI